MSYEELWHRLTNVYDAGEAKAVTRLVLDVRFGLSFADILCGKVTELSANDQTELEKIMQRLENGEPVQYVIGAADFCGRQFYVAPGVLIPRPETAELCSWILADQGSAPYTALDIGTGSGCIAITLAAELADAAATGWDVSEAALRIARENASRLGVQVTFEHHDILHAAPQTEEWDIIVSNPPYIKPSESDEMAKNVLAYEPHLALFAPEANPVIFYQRIGDYAIQSLKPGGTLYFELNPLTADDVARYLAGLGFQDIEFRQDQFGKQRFLKATKI